MGYLPCLLLEPSSSCINLPRVSQWKVQSVINVNEGVTEEHGMADLFQQQIDVSGVPFLHTLNYLPVLRNVVIANGWLLTFKVISAWLQTLLVISELTYTISNVCYKFTVFWMQTLSLFKCCQWLIYLILYWFRFWTSTLLFKGLTWPNIALIMDYCWFFLHTLFIRENQY